MLKRKQIIPPEFPRPINNICLMGEVILADLRNEENKVKTLSSPNAQTCIVLTLHAAGQYAAIGHFDAEGNTENTVENIVDQFIQAGVDPKNIKAQLFGGQGKLSFCFSTEGVYNAINRGLQNKAVANITHDHYSHFICWGHTYDVSLNLKDGTVSVVTDQLDNSVSFFKRATPEQIKAFQKRIDLNPRDPNNQQALQYQVRQLQN